MSWMLAVLLAYKLVFFGDDSSVVKLLFIHSSWCNGLLLVWSPPSTLRPWYCLPTSHCESHFRISTARHSCRTIWHCASPSYALTSGLWLLRSDWLVRLVPCCLDILPSYVSLDHAHHLPFFSFPIVLHSLTTSGNFGHRSGRLFCTFAFSQFPYARLWGISGKLTHPVAEMNYDAEGHQPILSWTDLSIWIAVCLLVVYMLSNTCPDCYGWWKSQNIQNSATIVREDNASFLVFVCAWWADER